MSDPITVQVALRVRPLVDTEIARGCQNSLNCILSENQVQVPGTDKAFTYNYVFDEMTTQSDFYNTAIKQMISKLFKGFNVTILAYGQTGSGKTHSMGTNYDGIGEMGVIPRAINDIFDCVNNSSDYEFRISVSFIELYQENLYDLLSNKSRDQCLIDIREDTKGIKMPGLTELPVTSSRETIKCLIEGSAGRAVGATAMNAQSSRSHAIFTITVYMQKKNDTNSATTAKFHLVDLAGSERSKKTKATGERFREGVNINKGLLALGNVISALGDEAQKGFISYRDSKLTRLLQDSLGGNSITLMIACVSPADYNLDETMSTLRYADRARKIKNKPIINQDPKSAEILRLNQIIQQLRVERLCNGQSVIPSEELDKLRTENIALQNKNRELVAALSSALSENTVMFERALLTQANNDKLRKIMLGLQETSNITLNNFSALEQNNESAIDIKEHLISMKNLINDLNSEHKKNEEELQKHEFQASTPHLSRHNSVNHELHNSEPDLDEHQEKYTEKQLHYNTELHELNRVLALKEQLASQIMANTNHIADYTALSENEIKIVKLEKEKDELTQQLKNVHSSSVSSKISETRRVRVKELENQINDLKKKVTEQARLIKMKEKDEAKIKQLNKEIQTMKSAKVKLIKTMRSEEQSFRTWKTQREKDIMRLKDQDRKRQNQIVIMERMHSKQQNVWKRKVEEASAVNKRLKDALALQKQVRDRRVQQSGNNMERIESWIEREFVIMTSTTDAERSLETLIEDRAMLNEQLSKLRSDLEYTNSEEGEQMIRQLTEEIECRNAQIADLQQKIIDSDQENHSRTRWDTIQSMVDAKCALKKLFEMAASIKKGTVTNEYRLKDLKYAHKEALNKLQDYDTKLKEQSSRYKREISEIERNYEEKITVLLKQLRGITTDGAEENLKERLKIQEEALEKMDNLRNELESYKQEVETLRERMNQINKPDKKKKKIKLEVPKISMTPPNQQLFDDCDDDDIKDDPDKDPDWKKTPLYRKLVSLKTRSNNQNLDQTDRAIKRSSDGTVKCLCKTKCKTNVCGCKKLNNLCSDLCKCTAENCLNRDTTQSIGPKKLFEDSDESSEGFLKNLSPLKENNDTVAKKKKKYFQ